MTRPAIIHVLGEIHPAALEHLRRHAVILTEADPFPSICDGIIVRSRRISAADIDACPNLKVIGKHGVGTDTIDVDAAAKRGIPVRTTPGANAESVADLAVGFALALIRNIHEITLDLKAGGPVSPGLVRGFELAELPVAIAGLGSVGRAVARRLVNGFGCEVIAFDPGLPDTEWPKNVARAESLTALLAGARLLFIHMPLVPETRDCIDARALESMPSRSYLVNCARGGIVDEAALAAALANGHLAGAASDVFACEPPRADNPLLAFRGFLAMPHLGASTNRGLERVGTTIVEEVLDAIDAALLPAWRHQSGQHDSRQRGTTHDNRISHPFQTRETSGRSGPQICRLAGCERLGFDEPHDLGRSPAPTVPRTRHQDGGVGFDREDASQRQPDGS